VTYGCPFAISHGNKSNTEKIMTLSLGLLVLLFGATWIMLRTARTPLLVLIPVLVAALSLSGCSAASSSTSNANTANPSLDIGLVNSFQGAPCISHKLLVAVDQTGSRDWNGVASLTPAQLQFIADQISNTCGGELAVAAIRDDSNVPFQRCSFEPPPAVGPLPDKPSTNGNIFEVKRQGSAYKTKVAELASMLRAWQARAARARSECTQKLSKALDPVPLAPRTDVAGILNRARLYFSEEDGGRGQVRHTLLALGDGKDNIHHTPPPNLGPSVELIVVNSAGSLGQFSSYDPKRFESTDAALKWVFRPSGREK
jgi:hypothetical protein